MSYKLLLVETGAYRGYFELATSPGGALTKLLAQLACKISHYGIDPDHSFHIVRQTGERGCVHWTAPKRNFLRQRSRLNRKRLIFKHDTHQLDSLQLWSRK